MKHNIYSIQNFCNTLLSDWVKWNSGLLRGNFSTDASNVTQALGVDNSTGRSRAKEMYRIGLLTMELTKGTDALTNIRNGYNVQSRLGYLSALIFKGYQKRQTDNIRKGFIALCSIFSVIQSFEIGPVNVSINTVIQRLLIAYPCPSDCDVFKWMRYLIAGFCCELSYSDDQENIIRFLKGEVNTLQLRIIENDEVSKKKKTSEKERTRAIITDTDSLRNVIDNKISLTNIFHQKTSLFSIGSLKGDDPEGYYGLAFKYFPDFLKVCFELEIKNIESSPFIPLYQDNEGDGCQKPYVVEALKKISKSNPDFKTSYQVIMNTIEAGAVEALMYLTDKPESAFTINLKPEELTQLAHKPLQQIYYGAPGTGKSHKTDEIASKYPETVRTTFHPDSDYSTFVGAYKPTMNKERKYVVIDKEEKPVKPMDGGSEYEEKIAYKFVKQAFLKAYVKAWKLFKETCVEGGELAPQFLVIEEINRGNCAQIFGDLFQLLDRKQNFSEYPIEADDDIRKSLLEVDTKENPSFGENGLELSPEQMAYINQVFDKEGEPSRLVADKICKGEVLVLPPNLYIWATMNTSDQSLFPIDSAFKRRWEWKYVRINEGKNKETGQPLNFRIQFTTLEGDKVDESWWDFIQKINEKIEGATKSEDKKLGYFFCKPDKKANEIDKENTIISAETFVGKVVFYLWQDVFKDYGFKSDIFKKEGNARLAFHDFYPHHIEPDEEKNPEGIDLKLVKKFIDKVMDKKPAGAPAETPAASGNE